MAVAGFSLESFLRTERARVEAALERALGQVLPLLPDELGPPASHGVREGGKRLRPILCAASFAACGGSEPSGEASPIYDLAVSVELVHAYSLMHDDLPCMDDAALRRGRPTPHTLYGERATTAAGVALIPAALLWSWRAAGRLGLGVEVRREVLRLLTRAAGASGMVGGQALDLLAEGRTPSRETLDALHGMKTGALLAASLRLGALAAQAPTEAGSALERYGRDIGLAFQIADDVLDATADAATLGKIPSDLDLEKATYVGLLGIDTARREAEERAREAVRSLRVGGVDSPALEALADYVVQRDS